jgi:hypothetical protein
VDSALDPLIQGVARRCGVIRTRAVSQTTTLLLLRFRFHIVTWRGADEIPLLAEACQVAGFRGRPDTPVWLPTADAEQLLDAQPDANVAPQQATQFVSRIVTAMSQLEEPLNDIARKQGAEVLAAHQRVRGAARLVGVRYEVVPQLPPDVLGVYVLLPLSA